MLIDTDLGRPGWVGRAGSATQGDCMAWSLQSRGKIMHPVFTPAPSSMKAAVYENERWAWQKIRLVKFLTMDCRLKKPFHTKPSGKQD
eukprot:6202120-Pleurochrysis_carterae.AAC.5